MSRNLEVVSSNTDSREGVPMLMDGAYDELERMIVTGEIDPGRWVSEVDLMNLTGFTRAPIRAAVQKLAMQGLMAIYPRRGAQICPLDFTQQFRALELRREVESLLVRSAARRGAPELRTQIGEIAAAFRETVITPDQAKNTELDIIYFRLLCEAADNKFAEAAMLSVKGLSRRFWILHQGLFGDKPYLATCQADVAQCVAEGDAEAAAARLHVLLDYIESFTLQVIGHSLKK